MKKVKILAVSALVVATSLVGCKKGEEDPFLSLRSRKARITNTWELSQRVSEYSESGDVSTTTTDYVDGVATREDSDGDITTWNQTTEVEILKDGTYKITSNYDDDLSTEEGIWIFAGGAGDVKNKEQILFQTTKYVDSDGDGSQYGVSTGFDEQYDIVRLKGNEMILEYTSNDFDGDYSRNRYVYIKKK